MGKQKFGKKDIFAPATKTEELDERKIEESMEASRRSKRAKKASKAKAVQENKPTSSPRLVIHSFRIREDLVEGLREYAFFGKTKIYKVINAAIEDFLKKNKKNHTRVLRES